MTTTSTVVAWAHQARGREFVHDLWKSGKRGALLSMIMGSGKTKLAIDLVNDLNSQIPLIICPVRVVEVWRAQFEKYSTVPYEFLALDDRAGSVQEKTAHARDMVRWALERKQRLAICINYEGARIEPFASWALRRPWEIVIADEIHRLQNPSGRTSRFLSKLGLNAFHRLGLTGTPMPHSPLNVWGEFHFLDRSIYDPTFGAFRLRYARMGGYHNKEIVEWRDLDDLYAKFREIAFQVDESALDLPDAIDETLTCDLEPEGARIYREMEEDMVAWIRDMDGQGIPVTAANSMVRLIRLQQITGGSLPNEQNQPVVINHAKESLLADFFEDIGSEPVVVFAVYRADLAAIHRAAMSAGLRSAEISGSRDELASWKKGESSVLAVQIQSGGEGIDLTRARLAVYYSHGFSLAQYKQSRSRIWRPPQTRNCRFYHCQVRNSIDQYVLRAVLARQDLVESVLKGLRKN